MINTPNTSNTNKKATKTTKSSLSLLNMMKISISNPEIFEAKKEAIKQAGKDHCYVISDFDRTLTYGTIDGKKTPSIISLLRDGKHLTEDYAEKAHALFDFYHPFEIDTKLSLEEKKAKMEERWGKHNQLLLSSHLKLSDLKNIAENGHLQLRKEVNQTLKKLHNANMPVIIFSASGCGDAIPLFLEYNNCNYDNITYLINSFKRDEKGNAYDINEPVIHSLNKDEGVFSKLPSLSKALAGRENVIVIGDGLGDAEMAKGATHDNILKIGILTLGTPELRKAYDEAFDMVLLGDGDLENIQNLLDELFG